MSPAQMWAATSAKFLRWRMTRAAERRDWQAVVDMSPALFHWLGAEAEKEPV